MLMCIALVTLALVFLGRATIAAMAPEPQRQILLEVCAQPLPDNARFTPDFGLAEVPTCTNRPSSFGHSDYWAVSKPLSASDQSGLRSKGFELALVSGSTWQTARTIYVRYQDGKVFTKRIDAAQAADTVQLGGQFADIIPARAVPIDRIGWHIEGGGDLRRVVLRPQLMTIGAARRANLVLSAVYAGVVGLLFGLIIHHLMMWTVMSHRFQLAYVSVLLLTLIYAITSSGITAWIWPEALNLTRLRLNYGFLGLITAATMWFTRAFFPHGVFGGRLSQIFTFAMGYIVITSLSYAALLPNGTTLLGPAYLANFAIAGLFFPVVLWRAWQIGSPIVGLFALGWTLPIASMAARLLNSLGILQTSIWIDNSTILALAIEALLSSIAIVWQIKAISDERDSARESEKAALQLADLDPLTGLLNRRAFLRLVLGRLEPQQLAIIDVDQFRQVNEIVGHIGGDNVLVKLARALDENLPKNAVVARLGGDEFAAILPDAEGVSAERLTDILTLSGIAGVRTITASVGVSVGSTATEADWHALYAAADHDLYAAKLDGRAKLSKALLDS